MIIYVDAREPKKCKERLEMLGYEVRDTMSVMDYETDEVLIERKEVHDLLSSAYDGRLHKQLFEAIQLRKAIFLVIHGDPRDLGRDKERMLWGLIASLGVRYGITVITILGPAFQAFVRAMYTIGMIARKAKEGKLGKIIKPKRLKYADVKVAAFAQLFRIPLPCAEELVKRYKNLNGLMNVTVEELMQIKGIGKSRARAIVRVLRE